MFDMSHGLQLNMKFDDLGRAINKAVYTAAVQTAVDIENDAIAAAPEDTGRLKNSIHVEVNKIAEAGVVAIEGTTDCGYGGYVEGGTYKTRPQPFLGPAFRKNADKLAERIRDLAQD